jgi:microcompartment protein CcmK/EutM
VSSIELLRTEHELRALHREQDTIGVVVDERLLMLRALAAIANDHHDPRALAEAVIVIIDRAANG